MGTAITLVGLLGGIGVIIWLVRIRRRRAAQASVTVANESAQAAAPGAAPVGASPAGAPPGYGDPNAAPQPGYGGAPQPGYGGAAAGQPQGATAQPPPGGFQGQGGGTVGP